jgi:taurine dioxygenase
MGIDVVPTGEVLGAEIRGVAVSEPLSAAEVVQIRQALLDHCVIFFRDQHITDEQQVRFTSYFGRPEEHVRNQPDRPIKEIFIVSMSKSMASRLGRSETGNYRFIPIFPI